MENQALHAALKLLARRDHFRAELGDKLRRKGFDEADVEAALAWCAERGYLEDATLARRFAALRAGERGWGPRRLVAELVARGVRREIAEAAVRVTGEEASAGLETALRRADRRAKAGWWRLPEGRARMVSSLLGRGFELDDARRAVNALAAAREMNDDASDDQPGDPVRLS